MIVTQKTNVNWLYVWGKPEIGLAIAVTYQSLCHWCEMPAGGNARSSEVQFFSQ